MVSAAHGVRVASEKSSNVRAAPLKNKTPNLFHPLAVLVFHQAVSRSRSGSEEEVEGRGLGEDAEVAVAGDEGNAGIHTVLRYQGIGEAGFASLGEHFSA